MTQSESKNQLSGEKEGTRKSLKNHGGATEESLINAANAALERLGVPKKLSGYRYLLAAICAVAEEPGYIDSITSKLYPAVAAKFASTPARVERCVRTAVEACFSTCDERIADEILGNIANPKTGKATNSEFIAAVAKYAKSGLIV